MRIGSLPLCITLIASSFCGAIAQDQYPIFACGPSAKLTKFVGERLRLPLPKDAVVKKGRDVDYSDYYVGYGKGKDRVWLSGIYGPHATSGQVSEKWLSASAEITKRTWTFGDGKGTDARGKLANGNYWRYLGMFGESIEYFDVPAEAASYFDRIIDKVCFWEYNR